MNKNDIVLNYNDSLIYESDFKLLDKNKWLNDSIIGFWYEYLEKETFKNSKNISFVNPSTVQYLKQCESLAEAQMCFLDPLELDLKDYVFFPLNDNKNNLSAGGSHWSLLCVDKKNSQFIHYDSITNSSNENDARKFFQKYKSYFKVNKFINAKDFPQQNNSSDCGVYVCAATELIANSVVDESSIDDFKSINPQSILDLRNKIKQIIINLSNI